MITVFLIFFFMIRWLRIFMFLISTIFVLSWWLFVVVTWNCIWIFSVMFQWSQLSFSMCIVALLNWFFTIASLKGQTKFSFVKVRETSKFFKAMSKATIWAFVTLTFFIKWTQLSFMIVLIFFFLIEIVFRILSVFGLSIVSASASSFSQIIISGRGLRLALFWIGSFVLNDFSFVRSVNSARIRQASWVFSFCRNTGLSWDRKWRGPLMFRILIGHS